MKIIDAYQFPTTADEAQAWTKVIRYSALSSRVLVVACTRIEGVWSAYCDAVDGMDHKREADAVLRHGDKLAEPVARVLFPQFENIPYDH